MSDIKKAIKHFECVKSDAVAVLDSGFGAKPNESDIVYKNRKLYAELAINALEKQIPKKPIYKGEFYSCPACGDEMTILNGDKFCVQCGQALDWSDAE